MGLFSIASLTVVFTSKGIHFPYFNGIRADILFDGLSAKQSMRYMHNACRRAETWRAKKNVMSYVNVPAKIGILTSKVNVLRNSHS
jgi:hypothetical protein